MAFSLILFDLDETLYPRSAGLMAAITERITQFIASRFGMSIQQADDLRQRLRALHGTALRGLMEEGYSVNIEDYFAYVHDIALDGMLTADPRLRAMLLNIPLRRAVLTNADIAHALRVLNHLNIQDCFERVIDIHALSYRNKPDPLVLHGDGNAGRATARGDLRRGYASQYARGAGDRHHHCAYRMPAQRCGGLLLG